MPPSACTRGGSEATALMRSPAKTRSPPMAGTAFGISTTSGCSWRKLRQGIRSSGFASARGAARRRLSHRRFPQCRSRRWHSAFAAALPDKEERAPAGTQPASSAPPHRGSHRTAQLSHLGTAPGKGSTPLPVPPEEGILCGRSGGGCPAPLYTAGLKTPIISHNSRV